MYDIFINTISQWMENYTLFTILLCFAWGLCSVALSPCHLAAVSVMSMPNIVNSPIKLKVPLFMLGHIIALFLVGSILIFFSYQLDIFGHFWTIPFGLLFIYLAWFLIRPHQCNHAHANQYNPGSILDKASKYISQTPMRFIWFGMVYATLSSTCVLAFLSPILFLANTQGIIYSLSLNLAFAIGHTLPLFLAGTLAFSLHKLLHHGSKQIKIIKYFVAIIVFIVGLILTLHPFLEMLGFDFHGHGDHGQYELHEHEHHEHEHHEHNKHEHHEHEHHEHEHN